jgi:hypothetical protein
LALYQSLSIQLQPKHKRYKSNTTSHKYSFLIDSGDINVVSGICSAPVLCYKQSTWRYVVAQLVEALQYKSEGSELDSWWCHWNFSLT